LSNANHIWTGLGCNLGPSVRNQLLSRTATAPQGEILKSGTNSEEFEEGRHNEVRYQVENGDFSYIHMGK
jgi:hypothetical protein